MKSISSTTTYLTFICVSLLGIIVCTSAYWVARQLLIKNFDQDLMLEYKHVTGVSRVWPDNDFYVDIDFDVATQFNLGGSRLFQVWSATEKWAPVRQVIDRSPMLIDLNIDLPYPVKTEHHTPYFYNLILPDGRPARAVFQRTLAPWAWDETGKRSTQEYDIDIDVVVARERQSLDESITILFHWMLIIAALVPLISFLVVYIVVGLGIAPLRDLASRVAGIKSSEEKIRTDTSWPIEVTPVVDKLNELLDRLDKGVQRERRFTGDLAHEMRTPLAELRVATDVALRANTKERLVLAVKQVNTLSHTIAELVNAMLVLTRIQSDNNNLKLNPVDIISLFKQQYERVQNRASARGIQVVIRSPCVLTVETDPTLLTTIFSNLINNAVEHAPEYTEINLKLEKQGKGFRLLIGNYAPDLEPQDLANLAEPFWCKEQSRKPAAHFGLGLAIVHEASACLNLKLDLNLDKENYLLFVCQSRD